MNPLRINNNKRLKNPVSMRIFDICKKKNSHLVHRSCRGGTSFLCRQRKDAKRTQRGESCFPPFNPLQGRCGGSSKLAREVCRLTERRPPAQIAGIPQSDRPCYFYWSDIKTTSYDFQKRKTESFIKQSFPKGQNKKANGGIRYDYGKTSLY